MLVILDSGICTYCHNKSTKSRSFLDLCFGKGQFSHIKFLSSVASVRLCGFVSPWRLEFSTSLYLSPALPWSSLEHCSAEKQHWGFLMVWIVDRRANRLFSTVPWSCPEVVLPEIGRCLTELQLQRRWHQNRFFSINFAKFLQGKKNQSVHLDLSLDWSTSRFELNSSLLKMRTKNYQLSPATRSFLWMRPGSLRLQINTSHSLHSIPVIVSFSDIKSVGQPYETHSLPT